MTIHLLRLSDTTDETYRRIREGLERAYAADELVDHQATALRARGVLGAVRALWGIRGNRLIIASEDLRQRRRLFIFKAIGILTNVRHRELRDDQGNRIVFSRTAFVLADLPRIALDILASYLLAVAWLMALPALWLTLRPIPVTPTRRRPLTIAFFRTDYYLGKQLGGSFTHIRGFTDGVLEGGHRQFFVASVVPATLDETTTPLYRFGYPRAFDFFPESTEMAYNLTLIAKALPILRRERPDFLYHRHSGYHVATAILARLLHIPLFLEVNNSEYWLRTQWDSAGFRWLLWLFEQVQFRAAHRLFVVSEVLKDDLVRLGADPAKIIVNPNGVSPAVFSPEVDGHPIRRELKVRKDEILVGFLGTFGVWHGVLVLAEAIPQALKAFKRLRFLMIGEGLLKPDVQQAVERAGVADRVTFAGLVPHERVPSYLAACDVLVSPHIQNADGTKFFGSPTKLFEYMAMGRAIVASDLEQIGQVLTDGQTARLVAPGDAPALAAALVEVAGNEPLRRRLGRQARQAAVDRHTWKVNADRVIAAYRSLGRQG
ncbi:glycosyltransferase family 4 protein [Candidatus Berkelbacteria bacterium]|nr:glycosyltransferase family 4 protein [Candidatus Berkelbacteria bacterium]